MQPRLIGDRAADGGDVVVIAGDGVDDVVGADGYELEPVMGVGLLLDALDPDVLGSRRIGMVEVDPPPHARRRGRCGR
jgi:hypothetical protein